MCQSTQFKDLVPSILNHLLETLHSPPFSIPDVEAIENRSYSLDNDKLHEAGYDAYVTGLCFIALCNRLGQFLLLKLCNFCIKIHVYNLIDSRIFTQTRNIYSTRRFSIIKSLFE